MRIKIQFLSNKLFLIFLSFRNCRVKKFVGFTLAELLLTLTVIGVLASLTIPGLLANIQESQFNTAWKNNYQIFSQAAKFSLLDRGGSFLKYGSVNPTMPSYTDFRNLFTPYLNYVKLCNNGVNPGNCWHKSGEYKYFDGSPVNDTVIFYDTEMTGAILKNGALVAFQNNYSGTANCNYSMSGYRICGDIYIDVNGFKGPNTVGKDIFGLHVIKDGISPYGIQEDRWNEPGKVAYGIGLSATSLKN